MSDSPEWFAPKRYGFGAGLPIAWQGWLVSILFLATVLGSAWFLSHRPIAMLAIVVTASALFILVAARTTRGGWRWRWGEND